MPKRMFIDSSHPEETRVVVMDGNTVDEFDFEAASRRPLKGNIYLAKVTRVEPSLQAAFVEYGGNRQGFLAFSEIHPDYYQIPVADRMALLAQQAQRLAAEDEGDFDAVSTSPAPPQEPMIAEDELHHEQHEDHHADLTSTSPHEQHDNHDAEDSSGQDDNDFARAAEFSADEAIALPENGTPENDPLANEVSESLETPRADVQLEATGAPIAEQRVDQPFSRPPRGPRRRPYKIQEVIKRRQIMLVQVVKEERGTKGAALTTFLSLAGRYCVLMPNTPRGGGISRKITNANDRRRLKSAAQALELPQGMGLIIRTAGANRTKVEIKRDYEYLLRLWDSVRELTLKSNAPSLVYEEGNLIKRSIRDLYNKDISEIIVDGEAGYRDAKEFMRMLMPSHAKNIKPYKDVVPLFQHYHVDAQLDAMFSSTVTLKSGGYIVINQTEALVAIDVNSGKATREHSIEETAHKTNLEAASEIARQLRLRDLAGLIVIDFIDMEDGRNDRNVEKRLRDALRDDRARVQIGKISQFGLLEMSRQRLRAGVVAGSTIQCPHCGGQGIVRSTESAALRLLRALEEEAQGKQSSDLRVKAPSDVVIYTLNQKRRELSRIEEAYDVVVTFDPQASMIGGTFEIERTAVRTPVQRPRLLSSNTEALKEDAANDVTLAEVPETEMLEESVEEDSEENFEEPSAVEANEIESEELHSGQVQTHSGQPGEGRHRRRRRRRGGRNRNGHHGQGGEHGGHGQAHENFVQSSEPQVTQGEPQIPHDAYAQTQGQGDNRQNAPQPMQGRPGEGQGQHEGGGRRRRRRRRGRHRRYDNQGNPIYGSPNQQGSMPPAEGSEQQHSKDGSGYQPNEPSSAEWSFEQTNPHEPANDQALQRPSYSIPVESTPLPAAERPTIRHTENANESVSDVRTEPVEEDTRPARKGWWQRRFKLGE